MADESKKYLVNIESNIDEYLDQLEKVRKERDEYFKQDLKLQGSETASQKQKDESTAKLRVLNQEYRNAQKNVELATKANKAQAGSYEKLYRQWQLAQTQLKLMGDGYIYLADGTRKLHPEFPKLSKEVADAKKSLNEFGREVNDNRLNVGNYTESIKAAFEGVGKSMLSMLSPVALITAGIAVAGKVFNGLKEAIMSTTVAMNAMNIVGQITKQMFYDIAVNGKLSTESMIAVAGAAKLMNEKRIVDRKSLVEYALLEREIAKLEFEEADKTKTRAERQVALNTAIAKQNELSDKKIINAKEDLKITRELLALRPQDEKLRKQEAENLVEIIRLDKERFENSKFNERRLSTFIQTEIDNRKKLFDAYYAEIEKTNEANDKAAIETAKKKDEEIEKDFKRWSDYWDKIDASEAARSKKEDEEIERKFKRWSDYWDRMDALEAERNKRDIEAGFEVQKIKAGNNIDALESVLDAEYDALIKSVEYQRATNNEKLLADQQYTEAKRELSLMRMAQSLREVELIGDIAGSLSDLFSRQTITAKALSVAQALISTYTAGVKAMEELPLGSGPFLRLLTLASVIAAGLVQVRNIVAVKVPGSGGGGGGTAPTAIAASIPAQRMYAQQVGTSIIAPTQTQVNALPNQNLLTATDIAAAIAKLPAPIVTVEDINARVASVKKVEVRSTI